MPQSPTRKNSSFGLIPPTRRSASFKDDGVKHPVDEISVCLRRVKAAEDALVEVREALVNIERTADRIQHTHVETTDDVTVLPVNARSGRSQPQVSASPEPAKRLAPDGATNMTSFVSTAGLSSAGSCRMTTFDLSALGGPEEVAQRHGVHIEDVLKCAKAFTECDVSGCGKVSAVELNVLLEEACGMRFSHIETAQILSRYDIDDSGDLGFEEFLKLYCETPLFKAADLDKNIARVGQEIRQQMENERLTPFERADGMGVSAKAVTNYLRKEIAEAGACFQMPVAACLLLFFVLSVSYHMRVEETHAVDTAITWDVFENANFAWSGEIPFENGRMGHKNLDDVNTIADFWSWMNLGIVPLFWPEGWDVSEVRTNVAARCVGVTEAFQSYGYNKTMLADMPNSGTWGDTCPESLNQPRVDRDHWGAKDNRSDYLYFYTIIGGLRMQQESAHKVPCPAGDQDLEKSVHASRCTADLGYWLEPELRNALKLQSMYLDRPGAETQYLLSRLPQSQIREQLRELENRVWLNPRTAKVSLMFVLYNPHMDLLTAVFIFFFFNRGGHFHKIVEPVSMWLHPYHGWWNYAFDATWTAIVVISFFHESWEFGQHCCQLGFRRGALVYMRLSNAVDWFSILYSIVIIFYWLAMQYMLVDISDLLKKGDVAIPGTFTDDQDRLSMYQKTVALMDSTYNFRAILAWYPFVIISRLFKAFAYQPRLAMVTKTMSQASIDIFHFMIVFASIFTIYATSAMILFGQELAYFANFSRAVSTIFRILLGDFEWDKMSRVGRLRANIWFWTFIWLVQLTMLNMLLAIVMDVYTEVKGSMGNAETIWSQAAEIWHRSRAVQTGKAMHLEKVLKAIDPTDLDDNDEEDGMLALEFYTVKTFCQAVPGMQDEQAREILIAAQEMFEDDQRTSTSLTDTAITVQRMASLLWKLHAAVQELFHMGELNASLIVNASEAAGQEKILDPSDSKEKREGGRKEEKEDTESKRVAITPELQVLRDVIDGFHKHHHVTEDLLSKYEEQLSLSASRNASRMVLEPQPQQIPPRPTEKPKPLFPGICASPRIHKRSAVADLSPNFTRKD